MTNLSYAENKLPASLTKGVISLLPKGKKDKELLDNWRPITLLNCSYKIISGVIAKRLNSVLPSIIHKDQCGFVKNRHMGDCLRKTYDTLNLAMEKKVTGLLLLIDFKKAFDSISFSYISKGNSS